MNDVLPAEGLEDWLVLDGGLTAVFQVGSFGEAAYRAAAIAKVQGFERSGALLIITGGRLTVLLTQGVRQSEPPDLELARAISSVARSWGLVVDRGRAQELLFAIGATDSTASPPPATVLPDLQSEKKS